MTVDYSVQATKQLKKLDVSVSKKILEYMDEVEKLENPRLRGKRLVGDFGGLWRYRVGAYRIICDIKDDILVILVVDIGHRKEVYK